MSEFEDDADIISCPLANYIDTGSMRPIGIAR